jgi:hypothetical protein
MFLRRKFLIPIDVATCLEKGECHGRKEDAGNKQVRSTCPTIRHAGTEGSQLQIGDQTEKGR